MKKLAFAALLVGASALTACGGGGGGDDDGVSVVDAGPTATQCDPVEQTGCADAEKCGQLSVTDTLAMTTCVPNGNRGLGEACETGAAGQDTGFDDCESTPGQGLQCLNGQCREICATSPDTCGDGF